MVSATEIEAMAMCKAIKFAIEIGLTKIEFEGDNLQIIRVLNDPKPNFTSYGHFVDVGKESASVLRSYSFSQVGKDSNTVTHVLARHAQCIDSYLVWFESPPPFIVSQILSDQASYYH